LLGYRLFVGAVLGSDFGAGGKVRIRFASILSAAVAFGVFQDAFAADMPIKAVVAAPAAAYNWAGWYVGGNIGYGWGVNSHPSAAATDPGSAFGFLFAGNGYFDGGRTPTPNVEQRGVIGGAQLGYNWMISLNWVAGVITDFQASRMKDSATNNIPAATLIAATQSNSVQTDWFGTLRGKLGFAQNNVLFYGTGGLAYGHVKTSGQFVNAVDTFVGSNSATKAGWAAGGGIDYGFASRWSIGAEYLYMNLGRVSYTETSAVRPRSYVTISNRAAANIVRATLNYKF
jgi:outer membrane immunogenic protein